MYNLIEESKSSKYLLSSPDNFYRKQDRGKRIRERKRRIETERRLTGDGERESMQSVLREWEGQKVSV